MQSEFVKDLLLPPSARNATSVNHVLEAVASSTSQERAQSFIEAVKGPATTKAYGSYLNLVQDPAVDIIYLATPHSHHFQHAMLCLNAGKHVLLEKPITVNTAQASTLFEKAKEKRLFLMEAVWTRFFPLSIALRQRVTAHEIGPIRRVLADLSVGEDVENAFDVNHRMVNSGLAGGALLDLGIYSLTWVFQFLYHVLPPDQQEQPSVASSMVKYSATGVDESTAIVLTFAKAGTQAVATTSMRIAGNPDGCHSAGPAIRIQGDKGEIQVFGPAYRPTKFKIVMRANGEKPNVLEETEMEIPGQGMFWEADECARCLARGDIESEGMPWRESLAVMRVMDEVRRQNGLVYPGAIESVEYPLEGFSVGV